MDKMESILIENLETFTQFARKRVSDPDLAFDVVQDSFLKAINSSYNLKSQEKLLPWFYQILRRTIIDLYRKRNIESKLLKKIEQELEFDQEIENITCQCIYSLIPVLKPEYSEIIKELDLHEKSSDTLAKELGISKNNLKVRHHRAREKLREKLEQICGVCTKHGCLNCSCSYKEKL